MCGGLGCGKFFIDEVARIESQHRSKLPKSSYTPEELEAGFERLAKSFGVYGTLLYLEKETKYKLEEIEQKSVYEIYHRLQYLAWYNHTVSEYQKIQDRKLNAKGNGKNRR